jgi:cholesterol oxidase
VLVLERGRRWSVGEYPRQPGDAWRYDNDNPAEHNGWMDFQMFRHMSVVAGAGVGGGSLIYANIHVEAKKDLFETGWPPQITLEELQPYYDKVTYMMQLQQVPKNQWPERTRIMHSAAIKTGYGDRFRQLDLAVSFSEDWNYDLEDPYNSSHSKKFTNVHGVEQGTCIHCGNCDIGCEVHAKNTLDLNYIPTAEKHGAEVRPLHLVRTIEPMDGGYRVRYDRIAGANLEPGSVTGRIVILAAGSMGSTELLLRQRDEHKTLRELGGMVGKGWSSNADFLTPAFHFDRFVNPMRGPTITSAIDFLGERNLNGDHFFIEDGGFPNVLRNYIESEDEFAATHLVWRSLLNTLRRGLRDHNVNNVKSPLDHAMPWFAQGRDYGDGVMRLKREYALFGKRKLDLKWDIGRSERVIEAIIAMHKKLARSLGGIPAEPLFWTLDRYLVTPHPLGGANMGTRRANGVVNHKGEVFAYKNLYVADGAIIPEAIGANPSKTIAALAERIAALIIAEGR